MTPDTWFILQTTLFFWDPTNWKTKAKQISLGNCHRFTTKIKSQTWQTTALTLHREPKMIIEIDIFYWNGFPANLLCQQKQKKGKKSGDKSPPPCTRGETNKLNLVTKIGQITFLLSSVAHPRGNFSFGSFYGCIPDVHYLSSSQKFKMFDNVHDRPFFWC